MWHQTLLKMGLVPAIPVSLNPSQLCPHAGRSFDDLSIPVERLGGNRRSPPVSRYWSGRRGSRTLKAHRSPDFKSGGVARQLALPSFLIALMLTEALHREELSR
jgi:hypothetical protein